MATVTISNISKGSKNIQIIAKSSVKSKLFVKLRNTKRSNSIRITIKPEQFVRHSIVQKCVKLSDKGSISTCPTLVNKQQSQQLDTKHFVN